VYQLETGGMRMRESYKRETYRRTIYLKNNVCIEICWHHGMKTWMGIYDFANVGMGIENSGKVFGATRVEVVRKLRLKIAGVENPKILQVLQALSPGPKLSKFTSYDKDHVERIQKVFQLGEQKWLK
jgi:hypothetical protein